MIKSLLLIACFGILFGFSLLESRFSRQPPSRSEPKSRRRGFLWIFAITWVCGLAVCFGFSVYVNPWGNYGEVGWHRLYNARLAKTRVLDHLPGDELPEVLILGSSNVMRLRPATVRRELGLTAFNCGVFWGKAEDYLCIARHVILDLNHRPKLLLVGLDSWTLAPAQDEHPVFPGLRRRLLNTPQLIQHLHDVSPVKREWSRFIDAFSRQHLVTCWRMARSRKRHRVAPLAESEMFQEDGTRNNYSAVYEKRAGNIFDAVEARRYPITEHLRRIRSEAGPTGFVHFSKYDFREFRSQRIGYLRDLVELCQDQQVELVFFLNPVHPVFREVVEEHSPFLVNQSKMRHLIDQWMTEFSTVRGIVDGLEMRDLDPGGFYDEIHPDTANGDRLIALIGQSLERHR
ncbi:MAG: hypothetical protein VX346_03120 [Planctomycetota bacterium]|nr:hypothetical protein [Planctomycetota bacterium]